MSTIGVSILHSFFSLSESVIVSCAFDELIFFTVENLFIYLIINKQKNEII